MFKLDKRYSLLFLLIAAASANAGGGNVRWRGPNQPVYVVTHNHYAEGFSPSGQTARFGDLIMIEIFNPKAPPPDQSAGYKVGGRYALFMGGERRGDVKVKKVVPLQCDSSAAKVSTHPAVHLSTSTMALATNADGIRPHLNMQRNADETERAYARQLTIEEFRKHGVPDRLAKNLHIGNLVVTEVENHGPKVLIGSLSIKANGARHEIFLIGRVTSSTPATELARYHKTTDLEDGKDSQNVQFVDQLDLDNDGIDEVVTEVTGYESEGFEIYKRQNGLWRRVWVGGQGGC